MLQEYLYLLKAQEKYLEETNHNKEPIAYSIKSLYESPIKKIIIKLKLYFIFAKIKM